MKNKKLKLLALSIISSTVFASNDFVTIIGEDEVKYIVGGFTERMEYTPWVFNREDNCQYDLNAEDFYYGVNFTQVETCDEIESREVSKIRVYDSGQEELLYKKTEERISTTIKKSPVNSIGVHLESSCKLILSNNYSTGSGLYPLSINNILEEKNCDMETDNGGWTEVVKAQDYTYGKSAPTITIDADGLDYSEMLYVDNGTWTDYTATTDEHWKFEGMNLENNVLLIDGDWYSRGLNHMGCASTPNKLPPESYRVLDRSTINNCHIGTETKMETCGNIVIVDLPENSKLQGYSDVESAYNGCNTDNTVSRDFKIFVR